MTDLDKNETEVNKIKRTEYDKNAPYDNATVWVAWVLFWPIAWGILSYISLKNLWYEYAKYVLIWSFLINILIAYILIFIIPDTSNLKIWFLWLMFMAFQQKQVKKWGEDNPNKKYKNWFKAFWWWLIWLALFLATTFMVAFTFSPSTTEINNNINISKNYPTEVKVGDNFNIEFSINNIDKIKHELKSIDIDNNFIDWIMITEETSKAIPVNDLFWMSSYKFNKSLAKDLDTKIIFNAKATKKWDYSWDVDFCIDSENTCIYSSIRIIVN